MQLGILTAPFPEQNLLTVADWAAGAGFKVLEVACWPAAGGEKRRYAGTSHIDGATLTRGQADDLTGALAAKGVGISALGYYPNPLHPDPAVRGAFVDHLKAVIAAAPLLGLSKVNTFVGGDRTKTLDQNWDDAQAVWPGVLAHAADHGVTVAFENCPMIFSHDEWPGGHNIAYSPYIWRRILNDWPGVGMNFDPSHLIWQMIEVGRFIREFAGAMTHVHAKDLMIDRDGLYERGIMSLGMGWQVPRMPGLGEVDWREVFSNLYRHGYDGPIVIEHEDRNFEGSEARIKAGFELARDVLAPFIK